VVGYLVAKNYIVYGFDLRGNGRSPGQRGHINSWAEFREDLVTFLKLVKTKESDSPCFVLAQSLGGAIALDYALRFGETLQGLILMSPTLGAVGISPLKLLLGRILSRIYPRFSLDTGIDFSASSRNPEVVKALAQDSLRHSRGSARLATEFFQTLTWIKKHIADLRSPLLILHGGADRVALPESIRLFFDQVTFPDKERKEYPESYHEIQNDLNYQAMLVDLEDWLARHLGEKSNLCQSSPK
jgi:alpha-beta hydrolase superfamily lysophospholipase